jgi:aryl-alcohol dehydrogenase-like predicted oxidoreductase
MTGDRIIDGSPRHAGAAVDASLKRLGVDYIDLIYLHVRFSLLAEM